MIASFVFALVAAGVAPPASDEADPPLDESSLSVEVITAEDIRRFGVTFIPEILRRMAGIDVGQATFSDFKVGIRGDVGRAYETDKVLLLIDGRPLMLEAFGTVWWNQIPVPLTMIQRIEITRGPGVTQYGSNALLGVVNLITKTAEQMSGVYADLAAGASTPTSTAPSSPILRTRVGGRGWSDDRVHSFRTATEVTSVLLRMNNGYTLRVPQSTTLVGYDYAPSPTRHLSLLYYDIGAARDYAHSPSDAAPWRDMTGDVNLSVEYKDDALASDKLSLRARGTYRSVFNLQPPVGLDLAGNLQTIPAGQMHTGIAEVVLRYAPMAAHVVSLGADVRATGVHSDLFNSAGSTGVNASLFAQYLWRPIDSVTVDAGLRGSMFTFPSANNAPFFLLMPRLGVAYRLASVHVLRASLGYSQRAPYMFDMFSKDLAPYSLQGNPALRPEGVLGVDVGYALTERNYQLTLATFVNVFDHLRERTDTEPVRAVSQSGVWATGGEASFAFRATEYARVRANYSLSLFYAQGSNARYAAGPSHKANAIIDIDLPFGFELNAAGGLVGPAAYVTQPADVFPLQVASTLPMRLYGDLALGWTFANGLALQLIATNVAQVGVTNLREYPGLGANPVATRILFNVAYRSPVASASTEWHEKWWVALLWGAIGTSLSLVPFLVGL